MRQGHCPADTVQARPGSTITAAPPLHRISNHTGPATQVFSDIVGQNPRYHRGFGPR